jgi:hypothetical protein
MESYIYIIAAKRGGGESEIGGIYTTYDKAIVSYHNILVRDENDQLDPTGNYFFWALYKMPTDVSFILDGVTWSKTKIQKSSKYRIKYTNYKEIIDEYKRITRSDKIKQIINE